MVVENNLLPFVVLCYTSCVSCV